MNIKNIFSKTLNHWKTNNAHRMGSALSYYVMLATVPLLTLIIVTSLIFFKHDIVENTLNSQLSNFVGESSSIYISDILHNVSLSNLSLKSMLISIITLIIGTVGMFSELNNDLDELWNCKSAGSKGLTFKLKIKKFISSKLVLLVTIPLLALLLLASILSSLFFKYLQTKIHSIALFYDLFPIIPITASFILSVAMFTIIYRIFPNRKYPLRVLLVGAVFTASLFVLGNIMISLYMDYVANFSQYGGASTVIAFLVWTYYSAQIFFFGSSFTYVYAKNEHIISSDNASSQ